jgi:hypothetical protein
MSGSTERRACLADGEAGYFYGIFQFASIYTAMLRGEVSGQIAYPMALVEMQTGEIKYFEPYKVVFQAKEAESGDKGRGS